MKRLTVVLVALAGATSCGYKQPIGEMCGNAGAASFSIPNSELYIWERGAENPPPPGSSANISGAVLMLRWPDMEPRSGSNNGEFRKTYERSMGSTPWLAVSMYRSDTEFPKDQISRRLSHYLERLYAGKGVCHIAMMYMDLGMLYISHRLDCCMRMYGFSGGVVMVPSII